MTVQVAPRYVNDRCVACDACAEACTAWRVNDFNYGLDKTKAAYIPFDFAFPQKYVIDTAVCSGDCGQKCPEACKYEAIDLDMKPQTQNFQVGAIILAGGWELYDTAKIDNLGFGQRGQRHHQHADGAPGGRQRPHRRPDPAALGPEAPQKGGLCPVRRFPGRKPPALLLLHLLHGFPEAGHLSAGEGPGDRSHIFYIDMRTPGRYEQFIWKVRDDEKVKLIRGKVAKVSQAPGTDDVVVVAENTATGDKQNQTFDMVVLAAGMVPSTKNLPLPPAPLLHPRRLHHRGTPAGGVYAVGTLKGPLDVMKSNEDATGAALKSLIALGRRPWQWKRKYGVYLCKGCGIGEAIEFGEPGQGDQEGRQDPVSSRSTTSCAAPRPGHDPGGHQAGRRGHQLPWSSRPAPPG